VKSRDQGHGSVLEKRTGPKGHRQKDIGIDSHKLNKQSTETGRRISFSVDGREDRLSVLAAVCEEVGIQFPKLNATLVHKSHAKKKSSNKKGRL
jgi:hypothetical protein